MVELISEVPTIKAIIRKPGDGLWAIGNSRWEIKEIGKVLRIRSHGQSRNRKRAQSP